MPASSLANGGGQSGRVVWTPLVQFKYENPYVAQKRVLEIEALLDLSKEWRCLGFYPLYHVVVLETFLTKGINSTTVLEINRRNK
jgi:hypothetical protein